MCKRFSVYYGFEIYIFFAYEGIAYISKIKWYKLFNYNTHNVCFVYNISLSVYL
ncbi:MAG: hypothetical protein ACKESC_01110 [Candidatus Hodgkinia cicadicola]